MKFLRETKQSVISAYDVIAKLQDKLLRLYKVNISNADALSLVSNVAVHKRSAALCTTER